VAAQQVQQEQQPGQQQAQQQHQQPEASTAPAAAAAAAGPSGTASDGSTLSGLRGEIIAPSREEAAGRDFTLSDLEDCTVFLPAPLAALFLHRLRRCRVYTGPVAGACFVEGAEDCMLMIAARQVRCCCAMRCRAMPCCGMAAGWKRFCALAGFRLQAAVLSSSSVPSPPSSSPPLPSIPLLPNPLAALHRCAYTPPTAPTVTCECGATPSSNTPLACGLRRMRPAMRVQLLTWQPRGWSQIAACGSRSTTLGGCGPRPRHTGKCCLRGSGRGRPAPLALLAAAAAAAVVTQAGAAAVSWAGAAAAARALTELAGGSGSPGSAAADQHMT
jgi:hypothetical protein